MKDPAVLFYTSDFLAGTFTMTDEQVGKYIRLLCLQHQRGFLTENDMKIICKSNDELIMSKFIKIDGKFYNERMKIEAEKRKNYIQSRSENKKGKGKKHKKIISKSYDNHMGNGNGNGNKDENKNENEIVFPFNSEKFLSTWKIWKDYRKEIKKPIKGIISEQAALKNLSEISGLDEITAIKIIEQSMANNWQGLFELNIKNNGKQVDKDEEYLRRCREAIIDDITGGASN
jgi:hypothetical protein